MLIGELWTGQLIFIREYDYHRSPYQLLYLLTDLMRWFIVTLLVAYVSDCMTTDEYGKWTY